MRTPEPGKQRRVKRARDQAAKRDQGDADKRLPAGATREATGRPPAGAAPLLRLQRGMGNRAVAALIARAPSGATPASGAVPRLLQRDSDKPPAKSPRVVAFIIRKKDDGYIQDMRDYLATTRKGLEVYEVDNLDDIAVKAKELSAQGGKFDKVLVISHGQRDIGGLGMKRPNGQWEFVPPSDIKQWAQTAHGADLQGAMAPGAEVQVLGCYLGRYHEAGEAIAGAFGATSRASKGQEMIKTADFVANGKRISKAADVPKGEQARFRTWLLDTYASLRDAGEAPSLSDDAAKLAYMTELFDRSKGKIRSLYVEDPNTKQKLAAGSKDAKDLEDTETASPQSDRKTQWDAP